MLAKIPYRCNTSSCAMMCGVIVEQKLVLVFLPYLSFYSCQMNGLRPQWRYSAMPHAIFHHKSFDFCARNGGSLSIFAVDGIPCVAKFLSIFGIMAAVNIECTTYLYFGIMWICFNNCRKILTKRKRTTESLPVLWTKMADNPDGKASVISSVFLLRSKYTITSAEISNCMIIVKDFWCQSSHKKGTSFFCQ